MELPLYDITTGTGDFIADGVVSHNCFARPTHEYLDLDAGRRVRARDRREGQRPRGPADRARAAVLARAPHRDGHEHRPVPVGRVPLQAHAGDLDGAPRRANPCSILTKSPLLLRDLDLMKEVATSPRCTPALGPDARPQRVAGDRAAHAQPARAAGGGGRAQPSRHPDRHPDRPADAGINDAPEQVERIIELATEAGAVHRRDHAAPARLGRKDVLRLAARAPARPRAPLRAAIRPRRLRPRPSAARRARGGPALGGGCLPGAFPGPPGRIGRGRSRGGAAARERWPPSGAARCRQSGGHCPSRADRSAERRTTTSRRSRCSHVQGTGSAGRGARRAVRHPPLGRVQRDRATGGGRRRPAAGGVAPVRRACRAGRAGLAAIPRRRAGAGQRPTPSGGGRDAAPTRRPSGATSTSPRSRSIARVPPRRPPRASWSPTHAGSRAGVVEHARVADEAREHHGHADAAARRSSRSAGEAAQAELGRPVDRAAGAGGLARQRRHEHDVAGAARGHGLARAGARAPSARAG